MLADSAASETARGEITNIVCSHRRLGRSTGDGSGEQRSNGEEVRSGGSEEILVVEKRIQRLWILLQIGILLQIDKLESRLKVSSVTGLTPGP
jgi:hypothetical protein